MPERGMMNGAEDFRVHPCGIRAEDLVQALLVHFSNRLVSSPVSARSSGAEITPFWRAIGTRFERIFNLTYQSWHMIQRNGTLPRGLYEFDATYSPR